MTRKQIERKMREEGWELIRHTGAHYQWRRNDQQITIVVHGKRVVAHPKAIERDKRKHRV